MKLRWKYFIVLLVASLVPLAVVTAISQKASKKLGRSISASTQNAVYESVRRELVSATENYALITQRSKSSIEFALRGLTREVAEALSRQPPPVEKIYFATDFEDYQTAPEDLAPSETHLKILEHGRRQPAEVSYQHPNFLLAPGVNPANVQTDIACLALLTPAMKGIAHELGDSLFWIYASLESGVHVSFPGHGGYPRGYDPRLRPWYAHAREAGSLVWSPPIVDSTTNQLTFTASAPFFHPDESLAGVAAIDVLIPNVLLERQISSQWSRSVRSFLVGHSDKSGNGVKEMWILAQATTAGDDGTASDYQWPASTIEEQTDFLQLVNQYGSASSGILEMPYHGVASIWAFATIFPDLHFVIIAPKSMVMELSEAVGDSFTGYAMVQSLITMTAAVLVVIIVAVLALLISRMNTKNVVRIVNGFTRLEKGDFSARLDLRFRDERDMIVTTFNRIVPQLEEHLRMSRALGVAKDVQQSLLPEKNPALPGFDIAGTSLYCEETGGDYYDFIEMDKDRLAVVVGDVSGHGVSSALLMATARALIMLRASMPGSAASIIRDVNRHLSLDTQNSGDFMTFFYCELAARSHEVRWVRAGHDPAIVYDPDTDQFNELPGKGLAFGLDYDFEYDEFQRELTPGQIIFIGTDGIWEMHNEDDELFGKDRLREIIKTNHAATAREMLTSITEALQNFRGRNQADDDVTMVAIKLLP